MTSSSILEMDSEEIGFSQCDIEPLEGVASRLRCSSLGITTDTALFDNVQTQLERRNSQDSAMISCNKTCGTLYDPCSTTDAATRTVQVAEPSASVIQNEPIHPDLHSLPVEVLRELIFLSTCEEMGLGPVCYLKRVLELQAVCRYFRDVVQASPEFWGFLSSAIPRLLHIQLERSKLHSLTLDLLSSDLRDERVSDVFKLQAERWQDLRIILQNDHDSSQLLCDQLASLTFGKVTKLELGYLHSQYLSAVLDRRLSGIFKCLVTRMPNISQLHLTNCLPASSIETGLTFLSLIIGEGTYWYGFRLPSFIASQPGLSKLHLVVRAGPQIYGMTEFMKWVTERSYDGKRALDVSIVLEGSGWTHTLNPIWPAMGLIGIAHLSIDLSGVPDQPRYDGLLCKALHLASNISVPGLQTFTISFNTSEELEWVCTEQHDISNEHELPTALQVLRAHNCSSTAAEILRALIERLLQRQAALHVPLFEKLQMTGNIPSEAARIHFEPY